MSERVRQGSYEIPDGALIIPGTDGRYWEHIKSAEQLARAMWQCKSFNVHRLYEAGGISDGNQQEPEGLVALRNMDGQLLMMGSFIADGIQWPTSPAGDNSLDIRSEYASAIEFLRSRAQDLFPVEIRETQLRR